MSYTAVKNKILKQLSYTNRDYDNLIKGLIKVIQNDEDFDDYDNISSSDPLFQILHLMAAHIDILNYQIDYKVLEGYGSTARERASLVRIANTFGYKIPSYKPAQAIFTSDDVDNINNIIPFVTTLFDEYGNQWHVVSEDDKRLSMVDEENKPTPELTAFQGIVQTLNIETDNIMSNSLTHLVSNRNIAIGRVLGSKGTTQLLVKNEQDEWEDSGYIEVPNVITYVPTDENPGFKVYELNVDTNNTTYIKFHRDSGIVGETNKEYQLRYLITEGKLITNTTDVKYALQENDSITLSYKEDSFIRGADPIETSEIRENIKKNYNLNETLVTLKDFKDYIELQNEVLGINKVLVYDKDGNTSNNTNSTIGITPVALQDLTIYIIYKSNETKTLEEIDLLRNNIKAKSFNGLTININEATDLTLELSTTTELTDNQKDVVLNIVKDYILNQVGIGEYIAVSDLYAAIFSNPNISRFSQGLTLSIEVSGEKSDRGIQLKYNEVINEVTWEE